MLPIVLTACLMSPQPRTFQCIDNMAHFGPRQSLREEPRASVLSTLFDAFAGGTAEEREKAQAEREAEHLKTMENLLAALKKKNNPADKELVATLEESVKLLKSHQHWR